MPLFANLSCINGLILTNYSSPTRFIANPDIPAVAACA